MRRSLRCDVVDTMRGVDRLESTWRQLWQADTEATPFQSFDWVRLWFAHYATYVERPLVITCMDGGVCVGIAPFYLRRRSLLGLRRGTLMFTGTGEAEIDESFAEYMAPICVPGYEAQCCEAIASLIVERFGKPAQFLRVRADRVGPLVRSLQRQGYSRCEEFQAGYRYMMPAGMEASLAELSSRQRNTHRRKIKRLRALPGFTLEVAEDEATRSRLFEWLVNLHNADWGSRGKPGVFSNRRFRTFHSDLSRALLPRGQLLLFALKVAHEPVAVIYALCDLGTCYYYQSGVSREAYASLSPGIMAHLFIAEEVAARGFSNYDLMMSSRESYKARIGVESEVLVSYRLQ